MNYDAIIKRAKKAIIHAENKVHASKVHIVDRDTDITNLSGLVIILSNPIEPKN